MPGLRNYTRIYPWYGSSAGTGCGLPLESGCFFRSAGDVAGAVGMSPRAGQLPAIDNPVFRADRSAIEPALQDLASPPHNGPAPRGSDVLTVTLDAAILVVPTSARMPFVATVGTRAQFA